MTDDIRQRHVDKNSLCGWCCCAWPCDAIRKQNEIDKMVLDFEDLHVRYVAANADAERLRLYARHDNMCEFALTQGPCSCGFDEVLAAHEALSSNRSG